MRWLQAGGGQWVAETLSALARADRRGLARNGPACYNAGMIGAPARSAALALILAGAGCAGRRPLSSSSSASAVPPIGNKRCARSLYRFQHESGPNAGEWSDVVLCFQRDGSVRWAPATKIGGLIRDGSLP